jgi:galactosylceramide sulfotransferase
LETNCTAKRNILFLKTHKTGSSTIQNIFMRYASKYNLTIAIPKRTNYFGHPSPFHRSMLKPKQSSLHYVQEPLRTVYNIFTHHARYNYKEMKTIMHEDAIFITILRKPVCLIESLFCYYRIQMNSSERACADSLKRFFTNWPNSANPYYLTTKRANGRFGFNQMSFDLGFNPKYFDDKERIMRFVSEIDVQFHLVMIMDLIDESLILMQNLLCLPLEDIIVFKHNARLGTQNCSLTSKLEKKIRMFNEADQILYDFFRTKLEYQIDTFGRSKMKKQVAILKDATDSMYKRCVEKTQLKQNVSSTSRIARLQPKANTDKICQELTMAELRYTELLRNRTTYNT